MRTKMMLCSPSAVFQAGVLACLCGLGTGCSLENVAASPVQAYFPPTDAPFVVVTTDPAPADHTVIAEVSASINDFTPNLVSKDRLSRMLASKGAEVGADMVVNTRFDMQYIANIATATGTAIKLNY